MKDEFCKDCVRVDYTVMIGDDCTELRAVIAPRLPGREERPHARPGTAQHQTPHTTAATQHHAGVAAWYALVCLIAALLAYEHQARFSDPAMCRCDEVSSDVGGSGGGIGGSSGGDRDGGGSDGSSGGGNGDESARQSGPQQSATSSTLTASNIQGSLDSSTSRAPFCQSQQKARQGESKRVG